MKITHNKVGQNLNVNDSKSEKAKEASNTSGVKKQSSVSANSAAPTSESSQAAKLELSSRAQDIKKAKEIATNSPDVDSAKVEKFKKLIAEGKYKVDAKAVADKMVNEHLMTAGMSDE